MNLKKGFVFVFAALFVAGGGITSGYAWGGFPHGMTAQASDANAAQGEEMIQLVNQSRISQGLLPLIRDMELMRLAKEHAEEMARLGFISHDPPSGSIFTRMSRTGYNFGTARENLARARRISYAHYALLKSPGHKANIYATDVSHIGIGTAKGDPALNGDYMYIVEIFATPAADYEPSQIKELMTARIEKLRSESPVFVEQDSDFEKMASNSLGALRDSYTSDDLHGFLVESSNELNDVGNSSISRLGVSVQRLSDPDDIIIPDAIRQGVAVTYGSAVRKVMDKNNRPVFLVLTLMGILRQPG